MGSAPACTPGSRGAAQARADQFTTGSSPGSRRSPQYYSKEGIPGRAADASTCIVCGNPHAGLSGVADAANASGAVEQTIRLECGHVYGLAPGRGDVHSDADPLLSLRLGASHARSFHDWCIRGWVLIGKKNTCPSCREKVNLQQFKTNPYARSSMARGPGSGPG